MAQDQDKCKNVIKGESIYSYGCCRKWALLLVFHFLNFNSGPFSLTKSKALWGIIAAYANKGVAASWRLMDTLCHLYFNHSEYFK